MASETPTDGRCNEPAWLNEEEREAEGTTKSGYCESYPVDGQDTCRMHFGTADRDGERGAPSGNTNAVTHGVYSASPLDLYDSLNEAEVNWIDSLVRGYLEHAPFGYEDPRRERLTKYCVMIYQEWSATEQILNDGASEEQPVGVNEAGRPVLRDQEHHLAKRERALNTKVRQGLKALGCLPGSGTDAEAAGETVAQIFAAAVEQASDDGDGDEPETITADGGEVEE